MLILISIQVSLHRSSVYCCSCCCCCDAFIVLIVTQNEKTIGTNCLSVSKEIKTNVREKEEVRTITLSFWSFRISSHARAFCSIWSRYSCDWFETGKPNGKNYTYFWFRFAHCLFVLFVSYTHIYVPLQCMCSVLPLFSFMFSLV